MPDTAESGVESTVAAIHQPRLPLRYDPERTFGGCGMVRTSLTALELCAGAGGQALGFEQAGFRHVALLENDPWACATLRANRHWKVVEADIRMVDGRQFAGVDLLDAGVPCPPFSVAGKQLGEDDERDLFPDLLRLVDEAQPRAVMAENVRGLLDPRFREYRARVEDRLRELGYVVVGWRLLQASDFGVPQLRPRVVMVAFRPEFAAFFSWPSKRHRAPSVGDALYSLMKSRGWRGARNWREGATGIAPTLVGGSKLHGGPDLGPTRAREAWARLGVDAGTIAEEPPARTDPPDLMPRLTVQMAGVIQGFPAEWDFEGRKTHAYRQVGNAFPPPVARAVGIRIRSALEQGLRATAPTAGS